MSLSRAMIHVHCCHQKNRGMGMGVSQTLVVSKIIFTNLFEKIELTRQKSLEPPFTL